MGNSGLMNARSTTDDPVDIRPARYRGPLSCWVLDRIFGDRSAVPHTDKLSAYLRWVAGRMPMVIALALAATVAFPEVTS